MKNWKIVLLFVLLLVISVGCTQQKKTQTSSGLDLLGDIYLYEYKYQNSELPEKYRNDVEYDYILYITSINVQNVSTSMSDNLSIEINGLDNYGQRMSELENDHFLTVDIGSSKIEFNSKKKNNYFIYRVKKDIKEINLNSLSIEYNNQKIQKSIDMFMTL